MSPPPNLTIGFETGITGLLLSNQLQEVRTDLQEVKTDLREFKKETANRFAESRADTAHTNRRLDEVHTILYTANNQKKKNKE
ncbi:hypothetical protein MMC07_007871 [Pseudocyphellaria aurata]|nr:hypothetical protein [Pseudocyphellaria aurata]